MEEEKQVSSSGVKDLAHKNGYNAYRPLLKPPLDPDKKKERYEFALMYQYKTMHFWSHVIFMDETVVRLYPQDSRKRVWRQEGERLAPEYLVPSVKFGGKGVMFWGCISLAGTGPLIAVEGSLRGSDYADILWQCIPQVKDSLGIQSAYIIEDHPKVHQTLEVLGTKEDLRLKDLKLPGYSPGLNAIETVWSIFKERVAKRAPETLDEIKRVAMQVWANFSLDDIRKHIQSMPDRLAEVVKRKGDSTKY